jgi:hypothetical protein
MDEKIIVMKLVNDEIIVGENYQIGEVTATVVNPVRYQVRGNEVFLTPFFGGPEAIVLFKERIVYVYEIAEDFLIQKYKQMISKSEIKLADKKIVLVS